MVCEAISKHKRRQRGREESTFLNVSGPRGLRSSAATEMSGATGAGAGPERDGLGVWTNVNKRKRPRDEFEDDGLSWHMFKTLPADVRTATWRDGET